MLIGSNNNAQRSPQDCVCNVPFTNGLSDTTPYPDPNLVEQYGVAGDAAWQPSNPPVYVGNCANFFSTGFTSINEAAPPNWHHHDVKAQGCIWRMPGGGVYPARSKHPGGVNAAMADGSVHFISQTINALTWQYLGARADGNPAALP
jgi:prepilin-type processing-associated H-X9-DG protein